MNEAKSGATSSAKPRWRPDCADLNVCTIRCMMMCSGSLPITEMMVIPL